MESKKIYLIRHGQTDYNLKGIVQGRKVNADLNATGHEQARLFYQAYKHVAFDKVYTSALIRTWQSVDPFIQQGIAHEAYEGLDEISWGNQDGKIVTHEDKEYYWGMLQRWTEGEVDYKIEGGESPLDVQARQLPVIDLLKARKHEKVILVCMHGRAMRILLSTLLDSDLRYMDEFEHSNLCLYIINFDGKCFTLELVNDTKHLYVGN